MAYLDVSPMMVALRTTPEEFELNGDWLQHIPSRHSFKFEPNGRVQINAECNCALLAIKSEQEQALSQCFQEWRTHYWRPLQINKEFASHFQPRSMLRRLLIAWTGKLYNRLVQRGVGHQEGPVMVPAE